MAQSVKNTPADAGDAEARSLIPGSEDPLEIEMATFQYSCLGNAMNKGAWWAVVHGVAESQT